MEASTFSKSLSLGHRSARVLLWVLLSFPAQTPGQTLSAQAAELVELAKVHPTQMEIGLAVVQDAVHNALKKTGGDPSKAISILASSPVPAMRAPDGTVWITDGHHRATAIELLAERLGIGGQMRVEIQADFQGGNWNEFYSLLEKRNKAHFTPELRGSSLSFTKKCERLPKTLEELAHHDNPLRSVVGTVLQQELQSDGSEFEDYIEFQIAEMLRANSFEVASGEELSHHVLKEAGQRIFSREGVQFLRRHVRNQELGAVIEPMLSHAQVRFENTAQPSPCGRGVLGSLTGRSRPGPP